MSKNIAVDFDNTIAKTRFPVIVGAIPESIYLKKWQRNGHKIWLWTSRAGKHKEEAIDWCITNLGFKFDVTDYEGKPDVDYFIDDRFPMPISLQWKTVNHLLGGK